MAQSIKRRTAAMTGTKNAAELRPLLEAILTDLAAIKSYSDTLATKLNNDSGVDDTNYAGTDTLTTVA